MQINEGTTLSANGDAGQVLISRKYISLVGATSTNEAIGKNWRLPIKPNPAKVNNWINDRKRCVRSQHLLTHQLLLIVPTRSVLQQRNL